MTIRLTSVLLMLGSGVVVGAGVVVVVVVVVVVGAGDVDVVVVVVRDIGGTVFVSNRCNVSELKGVKISPTPGVPMLEIALSLELSF